MTVSLEEELKKLPDQPGVYLMRDKSDAIIYIGKARSLTKRVHQYFQAGHNEGIKKAQMVRQIAYFEYIVTDSELEALVLECNLIKEHRPKYNTMLRDDKTYPYIRVTAEEAFPRVLFARRMKKDKSKYFGPYTSGGAVRDTIDLLNKLYGLRTCSRILPRDEGKERPCLNYHIKQCEAPCQGLICGEEYGRRVEQAIRFLNGEHQPVMQELKQKMQEAASGLEFEKAAEYRDLLESVRQIAQKQKMSDVNEEDQDIVGMAQDGEDAVVQIFFVRGGKLIGREHFYVRIAAEEAQEQILTAFLKQYYAGTPYIPKQIMLPCGITEHEIIEEWLTGRRGQKIYVKIPQKGRKEKLVELAAKNAALILSQDREKIKREEGRTIGAVKEIAGLLGLSGIVRIEAYDISNISGFQSVGSMVVYEKGKPCRSDYRKFRLKTVSGPDDYASMREVLTRRFSHGLNEQEELSQKGISEEYGSFTKFPDLIFMDGGKGQVNTALRVLEELHLKIPVCGMVKDDNHRTRGLYYNHAQIELDKHSEGFLLITRIQDEAHRFAIEYHRSLRGKGQVRSVLDDIPGVGAARRKALMMRFPSLDAIRSADLMELCDTPSMNMQAAKAVYQAFHAIDEKKNL